MNLFATLALAFSMSADALAAALGKGAALDKPRLTEALRAGLIFGTIEAITPVIGWGAGITASRFIGVNQFYPETHGGPSDQLPKKAASRPFYCPLDRLRPTGPTDFASCGR